MAIQSRLLHWQVRALAIVVVFTAAVLDLTGSEVSDPIKAKPPACDKQCASGVVVSCGPIGHRTWVTEEDLNADGILHEECATGYCTNGYFHDHDCVLETEDLQALSKAIEVNDVATLVDLVTADEGSVSVNTVRHAFQISNCSGMIVGHWSAHPDLITKVLERSSPGR